MFKRNDLAQFLMVALVHIFVLSFHMFGADSLAYGQASGDTKVENRHAKDKFEKDNHDILDELSKLEGHTLSKAKIEKFATESARVTPWRKYGFKEQFVHGVNKIVNPSKAARTKIGKFVSLKNLKENTSFQERLEALQREGDFDAKLAFYDASENRYIAISYMADGRKIRDAVTDIEDLNREVVEESAELSDFGIIVEYSKVTKIEDEIYSKTGKSVIHMAE